MPPKRRTGLIVGVVLGVVGLLACLGGVGTFAVIKLQQSAEDSSDPFAGTPAAEFAEAPAGIVMPEARAVGDFSESVVSEALDLVREALIASRVDQAMLVERDPGPFLALLALDNREFLQTAFESGDFSYFATQLADGAELAIPTPRVNGEITYQATVDNGNFRIIEITTNFVWAYAFVPPSDQSDLDGVVVIHDTLVWHMPYEDDMADSSKGLWLWEAEAYAWGIDCDLIQQGLVAPQRELTTLPDDAPDPTDIFDPAMPIDLPDNC